MGYMPLLMTDVVLLIFRSFLLVKLQTREAPPALLDDTDNNGEDDDGDDDDADGDL